MDPMAIARVVMATEVKTMQTKRKRGVQRMVKFQQTKMMISTVMVLSEVVRIDFLVSNFSAARLPKRG